MAESTDVKNHGQEKTKCKKEKESRKEVEKEGGGKKAMERSPLDTHTAGNKSK